MRLIHSGSSSFKLPAIDMAQYFPHLYGKGDGSKMSADQLSLFRVELDRHTSKIKRTFASLVYDLQKNIEKTSNIRDLVNALKFLDDKKIVEILADCSSIAEVFDRLSPYFSFFDFEVIKLLTKKFGSEFNKEKMERYKKMFKDYCKQRVCECPSDAFGDVEKSEKAFVIKTDKHIKSLTVDELKSLKYRISQSLKLQLRLIHIDDGCVQLSFRALGTDGMVITKEQQQLFSKLGVLSISYGRVNIFTADPVEITSDGKIPG